MYRVLWDNITRHITGTWRAIGTLVATAALFALVEKDIIPLDVATSLMVLAAGWYIAVAFDGSLWFNRNQHIVTNIEQLFLDPTNDTPLVHPYFQKHRKPTMTTHFLVQVSVGWSLILLFLTYHWNTRIVGNLNSSAPIQLTKALPYIFGIGILILTFYLQRKNKKSLCRLQSGSPGHIAIQQLHSRTESSQPGTTIQ